MLLTEAQKKQISRFIVYFVNVLREQTNMTKEQVEMMVQLGTATLLAAVLQIPPPTDETPDGVDAFVIGIIDAALEREYAREKVKVVD